VIVAVGDGAVTVLRHRRYQGQARCGSGLPTHTAIAHPGEAVQGYQKPPSAPVLGGFLFPSNQGERRALPVQNAAGGVGLLAIITR
jgi:hypothetical protein